MRTGVRPVFVVLCLALALGCQGNRDQLLADLQSPRPEVRAEAVKSLAKQGNADDLTSFLHLNADHITPAVGIRTPRVLRCVPNETVVVTGTDPTINATTGKPCRGKAAAQALAELLDVPGVIHAIHAADRSSALTKAIAALEPFQGRL
jgi:hypothetical protein